MISAFFGKSWLLLASLGVVRLIKDHLTTDPSAVANKANEENLKQNIAHVSSANEDPHKLISTIRYTGNELYVLICVSRLFVALC